MAKSLILLIGVVRLELTTPCSQSGANGSLKFFRKAFKIKLHKGSGYLNNPRRKPDSPLSNVIQMHWNARELTLI